MRKDVGGMTEASVPSVEREPLQARIIALRERLENLPYTEAWRRELTDLQGRLQRAERLVAVFGAFSTGKSSLINALLGESLLVVSPNPTTAAITELRRGSDVNADSLSPSTASVGTEVSGMPVALVETKTADQMWEDVSLALAAIQRQAEDLDDAARLVKSLKPRDVPIGKRKTLSFLKAFANGYEQLADRLGTQWTLSVDEASRFCAEEQYACFVQRVQLWHPDAALGGRVLPGLVLVDTPGVDSVHRRHTDVAFQYMRQADAILFVLYYTHAMSRAEKDFLLQLAEVQDLVGADKLFVVLNAVDLAQSDEERLAVRERVLSELRQLGIRQPRIYEVSSQLAFAARKLGERPDHPGLRELLRTRLQVRTDADLPDAGTVLEQSGILPLEQDLIAFLQTESQRMAEDAVRRTFRDLQERTLARVHQLQQAYDRSEAEREALAARQQETWMRLENLRKAAAAGEDDASRGLEREASELAFHAGERIRFRFAQLFREAFYPGRFQGPGSVQEALSGALLELVESLQRQVELECRTLALRIAAYAEQTYARDRRAWAQELEALGRSDLADALPEMRPLHLAEQPYRSALRPEPFMPHLKSFHSAKSFFEGGGQDAMLTAMAEVAAKVVPEDLTVLTHPMLATAISTLSEQYRILAETVLQAATRAQAEPASEREQLVQWQKLAADLAEWAQHDVGSRA
ncbi:dynamin family protein [Alicyclobacillus herbarius]|uniref:dynamin family protein n=1 Tax=Alicyclobacillus herbarius TaxID=122960 RepID=UPI0009D6DBEE|nr:dynamin family protein [Alicyclobacillus herbarius]